MSNTASFQVAFITGMSNPNSWHLSPDQKNFIEQLNLNREEINLLNFPYNAGSKPFKKINIIRASYENAKIFCFSYLKGYQKKYVPSIRALLDRTEYTLFLSGSCGLHLLSKLELPEGYWGKIRVFSYGPVSMCKPPCNVLSVQGEKDRISRFFLKKVDYIVPGGHMSYMEEKQVVDICQAYIDNMKIELGIT